MPHLLGSSVSYRIAVGPQQGRKAFMIRTIRPHSTDLIPGWNASPRPTGSHSTLA